MVEWPSVPSPMARRIRALDWTATTFGPIEHWPLNLRSIVDLMLGAPGPAAIGWGTDQTTLFNDAFADLIGGDAAALLGRPFREIWSDRETSEIIAAVLAGKVRLSSDQYRELPHRADRPFAWLTSSWTPLYDGGGTPIGFSLASFETTEAVLAKRALQERELQQAYLLRLSDGLRALSDPVAIQREACRQLGEQLRTDHAYHVVLHPAEGVAVIEQDYTRGGVRSFVGSYSLAVLHWFVPLYRKGQPIVVADMRTTDLVPEPERTTLAADGVVAWIAVPLMSRGELVGALCVVHGEAFAWSEADVALVSETGERIWTAIERARAETLAQENDRHRLFLQEVRLRRTDGQYRGASRAGQPLGMDRFVSLSVDIAERHRAEERLRRNNALLNAINHIFDVTLGAASESELADIALKVAAELVASPVGFMGATNPRTGRLDTLAIFKSCEDSGKRHSAAALEGAVRSLYEPASCHNLAPSNPYQSPGSVLLLPIKQDGAVIGVVALAGRSGGYRPEDREAAEALAPAIGHALLSKRAETGLRESEQRFRQFAQASFDFLWILNAETFEGEFASPAVQRVWGIDPDASLGDARVWATHLVPEDRPAAFARLERVRNGETAVYEFRILRPSDGAFRWLRTHTFPIVDEDGRVRRIGGITTDVTDIHQAEHHQRVLLAELQHRVRNIMALIRSIVVRSAERAESVSDYAALVSGRLVTLARVQSRLTRAPQAGIAISTILRDELAARAEHDDQYDLAGLEIELAPKAAEVLTLAIHELTTNALKYGALSSSGGRVTVRWQRIERKDIPWLSLLWTETGGRASIEPAQGQGQRRGFGTELIEGLIPYELCGNGRIELTPEGACCQLEFPLTNGASILETHAPPPTSVNGGSLDMTGQAALDGHRILVVENEFYLANDTARALNRVGATVLGPYSDEATALRSLDRNRPTGAVMNINLGRQAAFGLARALTERGIPFVFVTGYEAEAIPPEFADVPRLEKPVELRRIVGSLAQRLGEQPLNPA